MSPYFGLIHGQACKQNMPKLRIYVRKHTQFNNDQILECREVRLEGLLYSCCIAIQPKLVFPLLVEKNIEMCWSHPSHDA